MRIVSLLIAGITLAGCATGPGPSHDAYIRSDGRAVDSGHLSATLAQCQGEGAALVGDYVGGDGAVPFLVGLNSRATKEAAITKGCMGRNGYISRS